MQRQAWLTVMLGVSIVALFLMLGVLASRVTLLTDGDLSATNEVVLTEKYESMLQEARQQGEVTIFVAFSTNENATDDFAAQKAAIAKGREALLNELSRQKFRLVSDLSAIPFVLLTVDEATLRYLIHLPQVTGIYPDQVYYDEAPAGTQ